MRSVPLDRPCIVCGRPDEEKPICYRGTDVCCGRCAQAAGQARARIAALVMTTPEHDFTD